MYKCSTALLKPSFNFSFHTRPPTSISSATPRKFRSPRDEASHGPIISIGPHTDDVLDALKVSDQAIPHLRFLIRHVGSTKWVDELQGKAWGFSTVEAIRIASAMIADVKPSKGPQVSVIGLKMNEQCETNWPDGNIDHASSSGSNFSLLHLSLPS
jgi:hypothetical protein